MNSSSDLVLFGGSSSGKLATRIARLLDLPLGRSFVEHFPDGEMNVRLDESIRGRNVFIVQSTSPPVSDNLVELLAFADACRRSAARDITAVIPYFGYARSDKRHARREPIMASMVADLLETVGISHVLTVDIHAPQIEGFFHVPVDNLTAQPTMVSSLRKELPKEIVVVSPDEGRVKVATQVARWLGSPVAIMHKQRDATGAAFISKVVGDVSEKPCLIVDDIIATGVTLFEAVNALIRAGARSEIFIAATHPVLSPGWRDRLQHPAIRKIFVTDSIPIPDPLPSFNIVSIDRLLAAAIRRLHSNETMADLYQHPMAVASANVNERWLIPDEACDRTIP